MNSMDVNKAVAAVLVAGIAFMVTGFIADGLVVSHNPTKPPIKIEVAQTSAPAAAAPTGPGPILGLLATADVKAGETEVSHICAACHTYNEGGKTLVGPNLYGVVGRKQGAEPGFSYSDAFKAKMKGTWTYQALNTWLAGPMKEVPGTRMAFAGISNDKQRADVIAFLRTLSKSPMPLPTAAEIAAEAPKPAAAKPAAAAAAAAPSFAEMVAKADPAKGATTVHGICAACHTLDKGGKTLVGPNLWDVVGRKQGAEPGFSYSSAFKDKMKGTWTYDALNTWLEGPMKEVPGTRMAFAGISSEQQRAEVVAYLRTLSDKPMPLPSAAAATPAAPAPAKPAAAATPAAAPAAGSSANEGAAAGAAPALAALLAKADPKQGAGTVNGICSACHTLNKGGGTRVGPNLWDVVGRKQGAEPGFSYSSAFKAKMKGIWTYQALDTWLEGPMKEVPGTRMAFAGISNAQQRADVIAYLRTLADKPAPLPK